MQIRKEWRGKGAACVVVLMASMLSAGCKSTGVVSDGVGADRERVIATSRKPLAPRIANRTVWPHPAGAYQALRQIPPALVATAYDVPLTVGVEAMQLAAWTWGGQDRVTLEGYDQWLELEALEPFNPAPPLPTPAEDAWMDRRPRTGWTVADPPSPAN